MKILKFLFTNLCLFQTNWEYRLDSIQLVKALKGNNSEPSDEESPLGIIDKEDFNHYKTPNLAEGKDEETVPKLIKKSVTDKDKEPSKSLDISKHESNDTKLETKDNSQNHDDSNDKNISLIRIKSENNLKDKKENKDGNQVNSKENQKEKSYNSKNFFTENFDDQEMEDAIKKIKDNPDFEKLDKERQNGKFASG